LSIEGYAAGVPVICTRWRAPPELTDESSGILIEPQDADGLRHAMKWLAHEGELFSDCVLE